MSEELKVRGHRKMMRLPSERERELFLELAPWFDQIGDEPAIKANAPDNIRKDFEEWLELSADFLQWDET